MSSVLRRQDAQKRTVASRWDERQREGEGECLRRWLCLSLMVLISDLFALFWVTRALLLVDFWAGAPGRGWGYVPRQEEKFPGRL